MGVARRYSSSVSRVNKGDISPRSVKLIGVLAEVIKLLGSKQKGIAHFSVFLPRSVSKFAKTLH
ncbi:hypothetical protein GCM10009111_28070 [Colwellia asteriadis]|uniref:Uncharacterized protein n=1 Tax=Colwellia asteriadis TaxID=517723 RepID=A0ABN1L9M5_9GAMM